MIKLNEGWYEIRNGYVFYLESFNTAIPIYIKVRNQKQQNMLVVVDEDGDIEFFEKENKEIKSLNLAETVLAESVHNYNKYLNLSIDSFNYATVAQPGRASASRADVLADVRVQNQNLDGSPGGGVSQDNSQQNKNQISGKVTGLEGVSGF